MGITASWSAIKGVGTAVVFERLGLIDKGEEADDDELSYARLPDDWLVVLSPGYADPPWRDLSDLSAGTQAVACIISETVMYSEARGFVDGRQVWSVIHNGGDKGPLHLDVGGEPPASFSAIRERLMDKQAVEDESRAMTDYVFDLPAELTYAICGYRADGAAMPAGDPVMTQLQRVRRSAPPREGGFFNLLARLLRRG